MVNACEVFSIVPSTLREGTKLYAFFFLAHFIYVVFIYIGSKNKLLNLQMSYFENKFQRLLAVSLWQKGNGQLKITYLANVDNLIKLGF